MNEWFMYAASTSKKDLTVKPKFLHNIQSTSNIVFISFVIIFFSSHKCDCTDAKICWVEACQGTVAVDNK